MKSIIEDRNNNAILNFRKGIAKSTGVANLLGADSKFRMLLLVAINRSVESLVRQVRRDIKERIK